MKQHRFAISCFPEIQLNVASFCKTFGTAQRADKKLKTLKGLAVDATAIWNSLLKRGLTGRILVSKGCSGAD